MFGTAAATEQIGTKVAQLRGVAEERVAVTVWGRRISPLFDVSQRALLLTIRRGQPTEQEEVTLPGGSGEAKLAFIRNQGVDTLLCGAVSQALAARAATLGLRMIPFLAGQVADVLSAYVLGQLPKEELTMPGCHADGAWRIREEGGQPPGGGSRSRRGRR
jgi:predicted Fe-Mo cluster-binding NifX family protein